ncbi:hypothetical protein EDB19DRAFT_1912027 [Suillus lakei]|nr:hypothetical protein EDB19DRAFT_1912027 [Suillus lakei]
MSERQYLAYVTALFIFSHETGIHLAQGTITLVILPTPDYTLIKADLQDTDSAIRFMDGLSFPAIVTDTPSRHLEVDDRPSESDLGGDGDGFMMNRP